MELVLYHSKTIFHQISTKPWRPGTRGVFTAIPSSTSRFRLLSFHSPPPAFLETHVKLPGDNKAGRDAPPPLRTRHAPRSNTPLSVRLDCTTPFYRCENQSSETTADLAQRHTSQKWWERLSPEPSAQLRQLFPSQVPGLCL